jgi:hypothetical protein
MHCQLVKRTVLSAALMTVLTGGKLSGQATTGHALSAVDQTMSYRRGALGDSVPYDACSVFEQTGRPSEFLNRFRPGVRGMLDRPLDDPCSVPRPNQGSRSERLIRVDTVLVTDSTAEVHLHVRRDGWRHGEVYYFTSRANGSGWALREVRMSPALHTTPPPPWTGEPAGGTKDVSLGPARQNVPRNARLQGTFPPPLTS